MSTQATLANSFLYEQCDIPAGMRLKDWRPLPPKPRRPVRLSRRPRRDAVAEPARALRAA